MASIFLRADGTQADPALATSSNAAATSMSAALHNAAAVALYNPGDILTISAVGGPYIDAAMPVAGLTVRKSGTSSDPIQYRVEGDVVMSQRTVKTGWGRYLATDIWYATQTTAPNQLFIDDVFGVQKAGETLAVEGDWLIDLAGAFYRHVVNMLYLFAPADPDTEYAAVGVTNSTRSYVFDLKGKDHIHLDASAGSLLVRQSYHSGVHYDSAAAAGRVGQRVIGVTAEWCQRNGIILSQGSDLYMDKCVARYCGKAGLYSALCTGPVAIRRSESYQNGRFQPVAFDALLVNTSGISCWGDVDASKQQQTLIEENYVHDNGPVGGGPSGSYGVGIWMDSCNGVDTAHRNILRRNRVANNEGNGVYLEKCFYTDSEYDVIYGNGLNTQANGLYVDSKDDKSCQHNRVIGAVLYGNYVGLRVIGDDAGTGDLSFNEFINIISFGNTNRELWVRYGGDNDGTNGHGNLYSHCCFGDEAAGFVQVGANTYATYALAAAAMNALEAGTWVRKLEIETDPMCVDPANGKFWLQGGSPCLKAGVNLGPSSKAGLHRASVWPDNVLAVSQSGTWDVGAYPDQWLEIGPLSHMRHFLRRRRRHGAARTGWIENLR